MSMVTLFQKQITNMNIALVYIVGFASERFGGGLSDFQSRATHPALLVAWFNKHVLLDTIWAN